MTEKMSTLWLNRPHKCIISHTRAKPTNVYKAGTLCKVSPHGRLLVPNNEDYNIDPNTYEGEFFQEDGLPGDFVIDITEALEIMEVEDDGGEEIDDDDDVVLLEKVAAGQDVDAPPADEYLSLIITITHVLQDMRDSDDETYDHDNLHEDVYY
jgi:hypothetical protein